MLKISGLALCLSIACNNMSYLVEVELSNSVSELDSVSTPHSLLSFPLSPDQTPRAWRSRSASAAGR